MVFALAGDSTTTTFIGLTLVSAARSEGRVTEHALAWLTIRKRGGPDGAPGGPRAPVPAAPCPGRGQTFGTGGAVRQPRPGSRPPRSPGSAVAAGPAGSKSGAAGSVNDGRVMPSRAARTSAAVSTRTAP